MRRSRFLLVLAALVGGGALSAYASETANPTVSSLDAYVLAPGGVMGVHGNNFSSSVQPSDCSLRGAPVVRFYLSNGGVYDGPLDGSASDGKVCSNTFARVRVPAAMTGSARIAVFDPGGKESNISGSGFVPQVTQQPVASVNPSAGQVGTTVAVQGSGLRPPSLAPNNGFTLTIGGGARGPINWSDGAITFDPHNASGNVHVQFQVSRDANNPSATVPVDVEAGVYTFQPPVLNGGTFSHQSVGTRFRIAGNNLGGAGSVVFPGGVPGQGVAWSSGGVGVTVPPGAQSGPLAVSVAGYGSPEQPNGPVSVQLDPSATGLAPGSASAGQGVRVTGYNFGTSPGTVQVGSTAESVSSWADQAVVFTVGADTDGGPVTVRRADGSAVGAANLTIVPRLDRLESNNVAPGAQVVVDGASLGAATGRVRLGEADAPALLWSRTSVLVQVPPDLVAGTYPLTLVSAAGTASNSLSLVVVVPPSPSPEPGASPRPKTPTVGIAGALAPSFDNNHDFVKPIKPPSPVYFNVTTDPHSIRAGGTADVVVTLKLNDKPLSGAQVKLAMLFTPGSDYSFAPESGVTDGNGQFKAKVKVSKNPGDSVIAATSGVFSDQDHVSGTGADGKVVKPSSVNPAAQGGGVIPLVGLGVLAIALVAAGFYLNIRSMAS
jgi:hypothetical protein